MKSTRPIRAAAVVFFLTLLLTMSIPVFAQTTVFINEIHYDNTGTDVGEAIEIAGPAGTDLTGWSLVLYNGSNSLAYTTTPLSGAIPNLQNGYGVVFVSYPSNGIQNGAPDGVALVDAANAVIQFLSYEGSFSAADGPASGLTSTDIGVSQSGSGPVGSSLQLEGTGTTYEDFVWAIEQPETFGAVNTGQSFGGIVEPAAPIINEFVVNHVGTDTHEFVEVAGDASTDYSAFTLLQIEGDGTGAGVIDSAIQVGTTNADGYWTTGFLGNVFENGTLTLLLVKDFTGSVSDDLDVGDDGVLDVTPWSSIVDDVAVNDGGSGDLTYATTVLAPGFSGSAFTPGGASRIPDGVDTDSAADWALNDFDGEGLPGFTGTPDPGEAVNTPDVVNALVPDVGGPIEVVISQVYGGGGNSGATLTHDFIELYNAGDDPVDISGWSVQYTSSSGTTWQVTSLSGTMAPGSYYLIQQAAGSGGSAPLPTPDAVGTIAMSATNGKVALVNSSTGLSGTCPLGDASLVDLVGYGTANCFEGSAATAALSNTTAAIRKDAGNQDTDDNAADFDVAAPNPRNSSGGGGGGGDIGACGEPATFIHEVQGSGLVSPLLGSTVVIEGVVVGDFQNNASADNGDLNGFYVQEEDSDADADPATSEGIFVFAPGAMDVSVGDQVRVGGVVAEFNGLTEISGVEAVQVCGTDNTISPTSVTIPTDLEAYEGMLVILDQTLYISEYFNYDRFGEIVLTPERQYQPTAVYEPGSPEQMALAAANAANRITLDDGRTTQNPDPAIHPNGMVFDLSNRFRGGDILNNVTGVVDFAFGLYRIQPTQGADYTSTNPRPAEPEDVGGSLKVASFNVLNYFTTIDTGAFICGPAGDQECRGADDANELARQRAKIIAALATINADVVGLIEIENHPGDVPTADLVSGLNDVLGSGTYAYIETGAIGTDAIRVAFIYKPGSVTPVGAYAVLDSSVDSRFDDTKNRPALAQSFLENSTGEIFTVAVNHLKSKGSDCNDVGDPDLGDGAGNCNLTRLAAAQALVDWLAADPTGSGDPDALIIGDLNSYDKEDPIDAILAGPDDTLGTSDDYTDLAFAFGGELAYTYVFDGQLGYLDYALANSSLVGQITGTTEWHINADEPDLLDYDTTFKQDPQDALYEPNAYRSSDHDAVIVGLSLSTSTGNTAPFCGDAYPSVGELWPPNGSFVAINVLGVTDADGDAISILVDSIYQDEPVFGPGSGNTGPDGMGVGTDTAYVRAERMGSGDGRFYHIFFTASDGNGGSCSGEVLVVVPRSLGGRVPPVDGGALYDSTVSRSRK
ncbi:MAG: ExeM/NucH family extracellular endonuclease [Anaerolineaceae bacterium]|nr:ExeM/NucH family extracellular endonuclease [Anaerolineaceae bacterium]